MKRKIKFPLKMDNEIEVRSIDELRDKFNIERVLKYFFSGKLNIWIKDRGYITELEQINKLDESSENLARELCDAIGVDYEKHKIYVNIDEIKNQIDELKSDENNVELIDDTKSKDQKRSEIYYDLLEYINRKYGDDVVVDNIKILEFINSNYIEIRDKFRSNKSSIYNCNIYKEMDVLENILVVIRNNNGGFPTKIYRLPLDIKVKFIYLLMDYRDKELDNIDRLELAGFYKIFERLLGLKRIDFIRLDDDFSISLYGIMMRHKDIFKKYIDSNYNK